MYKRQLLILRVNERVNPPQARSRAPKRRIRTSAKRAMIGVCLRRHMRARTPGERITKLLDLLRDFETHTQRLCKRLARGLTRLRPVLLAPMAAEALGQTLVTSSAAADTS